MTFSRLLACSISTIAFAAAAHAQEAPPTDAAPSGQVEPAPEAAQQDNNNDIVVTGIRQSQRASLDAKRDSSIVADVLSAEDIGKFPDKNVAEALQRVPGVVINRTFGEGERVSLRGTAPNLTRTLVNGHGIATADWFIEDQLAATRSFNYLTLPAEIVGQVDVYKSPEADIDEGGVGGTINVHTRDPLDLDAWTVSASAQAVYSSRADKVDPQGSALVSWKNADETFGVLVGGVYQRRHVRRDGVEVLGYFTPAAGQPTGSAQIPSLIGSALFQQDRERYGGNLGVQWKPDDRLEINVTGLYSRFNADNLNENFLAWGANAIGGGGTLTNGTVVDDTVVSGTITSTPTGRAVVYDAIDRQAYAEVYSGDFDLIAHPGSDRSTFHMKVGYTEAHGNTENQPFYEGGAPGAFTYDLTGRTPSVQFSGIDPNDPSDLAFDFASLHKIGNKDSETYVYADFEQQLGDNPKNAIKIGGKFSDHERVAEFLGTTYGGFFLPLLASGCNGGPCSSEDFFGGLTPGDYLENISDAGTLDSYWQVDPKKLESIFFGLPASARERIINPPENYSVREKIYGGYAMLRLGGDRWSGNIGGRLIHTDQISRGNEVGTSGPGSVGNAFGNYTPVRIDKSYTDFLPSANVKFNVTDQFVVRAAAGRTIARADYTDIVPRVSLNPGALTGDGGDPNVDPYRANSVDLSFEWYPDRDTIIAAALYYKDIKSYIVNDTMQEVFPIETNTPNLSRCTPAGTANPNLYNCLFDINRRSNGSGGENKGVEFQISKPLFAGFGVIANYTYSDAKSDAGDPIPGNSKHSANVTGYFENDFASLRLSYNYRSKFFINIDRASELNQKATQSLDASASIKLTDNISLTADAVNLTNEKLELYSGTESRPRAIYDNGRQFYAGARFRF